MIEISNLGLARGGRAVLRDLSLTVNDGEIVGITGPSGAGKTALLSALGGLIRRHRGSILVHGAALPRSGKRLAELVTYAGSAKPQNPDECVYNFLLLSRLVYKRPFRPFSDYDRQVAGDYLALFGLERDRDEPIGTLPCGALKCATLAHAFVRESRVLLLDNPTCDLDLRGTGNLRKALRRYAVDGNRTALIASGDLNFIAQTADRVIVMQEGRVAAEGTADMLDEEMIRRHFGVEVVMSRNIYNGRPEIHLFPET